MTHRVIRRLIGVLIAISLLHLSVAASDAACADHGGASSDVRMASGARHAMDASDAQHAMTMPASAASEHGPSAQVRTGESSLMSSAPCTVPVQPRCCESMTSCSVSCVASVRTARQGTAVALALAVSMPTRAPAFTLAAPEPPPPKA